MAVSDNLTWLRSLQTEIWSEEIEGDGSRVLLRHLTYPEVSRIKEVVEQEGLLTSMTEDSLLGGYGMRIYDHPVSPGVPPVRLFYFSERILPEYTRWDCLLDRDPPAHLGRDDAWEMFSKYTHSDQNRKWLKMYGMKPPEPRGYYDY